MADIATARPTVQGHKAWLATAKGTTGVSPNRVAWMYATHGPQIPQSVCACGCEEPRRHHWAWECKDTGGDKVEPPRSESEKRLCVPLVERPNHEEHRNYAPIRGIRSAVEATIRSRGWALIATDGGSKGTSFEERRASIGIAVGDKKWHEPIGGLDQTSYKSEVWALYKLLESIKGIRGKVVVIIDNQAVAREAALRRAGGGSERMN